MIINEIFFSIQGEGQWVGKPNIFVRITGCNLRCKYCDTKYAYENGRNMSISEIITEVRKYPCKNICITGGEPLLQNETKELIHNLLENNYSLILETNGSMSINDYLGNKKIIISLDIKCPSSDMSDKMVYENLSYLNPNDQVKFVISNKKDYKYAKEIINKYETKAMIFFQPEWSFDPKKISSWILRDGLNVNLSLQLHKIIWGNSRGK